MTKNMRRNVIYVADYIIFESNRLYNQQPLVYYSMSNLYLQKIMYFLDVLSAILTKKSMFNISEFQKWTYGPVVPYVYDEYKSFGGGKIKSPVKHHITSMFSKNGNFDPKYFTFDIKTFKKKNADKICFINKYIKPLLKIYPFDLVWKTHDETQWKKWSKYHLMNQNYNSKESINYWKHNDFCKELSKSI